MVTDNEFEVEAALLRAELGHVLEKLQETREELVTVTTERDRWFARMQKLERRLSAVEKAIDPKLDDER